jgi:hypothetical protein
MDQGGGECPGRDEGVHEVAVLRVEVDGPKVFLVVVRCEKEIASEEGGGLG